MQFTDLIAQTIRSTRSRPAGTSKYARSARFVQIGPDFMPIRANRSH